MAKLRKAVAFKGVRKADDCVVYVTDMKGRILGELDPRFDIANKSPTGFEWGYLGSGPTQLAIAMCCAVLGDEKESDPNVYLEFRNHVIARIKSDTWSLLGEDVRQTHLFKGEAHE